MSGTTTPAHSPDLPTVLPEGQAEVAIQTSADPSNPSAKQDVHSSQQETSFAEHVPSSSTSDAATSRNLLRLGVTTNPTKPQIDYHDFDKDYEKKYPEDAPGGETSEHARVWKVYVNESGNFDSAMVKGFRDSLDALLVFAALFSAVVTTLVIETSRALQPDQSLITNHLLLEQNLLIRAGFNATTLANVPYSELGPDSPASYSTWELVVNGLFFTSLCLSLSTALLAVLVRQWLQAYDSPTSGTPRERALVRHLRYTGLVQWRVPEIIGILPLVLHGSLAAFLLGLIIYVRSLSITISWVLVGISGFSFLFYAGSILVPAIDIKCPYRIPILYTPTQLLGRWLLIVAVVAEFLRLLPMFIFHELIGKHIPRRMKMKFYSTFSELWRSCRHIYKDIAGQAHRILNPIMTYFMIPSSFEEAQLLHVQSEKKSAPLVPDSILWLHEMSSYGSVRRIAAQSLSGRHFQFPNNGTWDDIKRWRFGKRALNHPVRVRGDHPIAHTAFKELLDDQAFPGPGTPYTSPYLRSLNTLAFLIKQKEHHVFGTWALVAAAARGETKHVSYILKWGITVDSRTNGRCPVHYSWPPAKAPLPGETALTAAARNGQLETVDFLLDLDADPNFANPDETLAWSVLSEACRNGHLEVAKLLIERGANVNAFQNPGTGPALQAACTRRTPNLEVIKLLLANGANVNGPGTFGGYGSAINAASVRAPIETVKFLLDEGAALKSTSPGTYKSALEAALEFRREDVATLLRQYGARD